MRSNNGSVLYVMLRHEYKASRWISLFNSAEEISNRWQALSKLKIMTFSNLDQ